MNDESLSNLDVDAVDDGTPCEGERRGAAAAVHEAAAVESSAMTPEQLAEARRYGRWQLGFQLADKALDLVFLSLAALVLARPLDAWLSETVPAALQYESWRVAALFMVVMLLHECVSFPLSFASGHALEHRFGLSRQSFGGWLRRHVKQFALALLFGAAMFVGLYWIIWTTGPWWWWVAAVGFFAVSIVLGQLAPVLILPLFYKIERFDNADLSARLARLAEGTGLSIEGTYRMTMSDETSKANAMLAGLGRTRRVIMGDTLLEGFSPDEIEVVFAHEIGHHVFAHIPKLIAVGFVYSLAGFFLADRALAAWIGGDYDPARMPVYALPMLMLVLSLFGVLLEPLQNAVSRRFERQCDRYALSRTGAAAAYRSAFEKLARLNKDDPHPPRLEVLLFHSHPPIGERLAMADSA